MIRHIVLQRFTDAAREADPQGKAALLKERFAALPGCVPGLMSLEFGLRLAGDRDYDLALCCLFESMEALQAYQVHPLHQQIKELSEDWVCGRTVLDFAL